MSLFLPLIKDADEFQKIFKENHWLKAISFLIQKHQLTGEVHRASLGSHIVYRVGNYWIKLMAPIFSRDMDYEISGLSAVNGRLPVATPRVLATGILEGWKYVILSHVEGQAVRFIWNDLKPNEKKKVTQEMAEITNCISKCPANETIQKRFVWNEFIQNQYLNVKAKQSKDELPEAWLIQLESFLSSFDQNDFKCSKPVFLHSDLTFDHFLVTRNEEVKISGVIDLADCQIGHPEYELIAPAVFILKGDRSLLREYFLGYGYREDQLNLQLSKKMMAWALLHRFCKIVNYFKSEMDQCLPGDFVALAHKSFPFDENFKK